ncbi:MAG: AraC family transcriptional regulator [Rhizobium sp.]
MTTSCGIPGAYCFYKRFEAAPARTVTFDRDYLLYSADGAMRITADGRSWLLPPVRAAWIPAAMPVTVAMSRPATCCSVLFDPEFIDRRVRQCSVFAMDALAREMILHSRRWSRDDVPLDVHAEVFLKALAETCIELARNPLELWVPTGQTDAVKLALSLTEDKLAGPVTMTEIADGCHMTSRSLARRIRGETGMSWGELLRRMRMIRATELLSEPESRVLEVALSAGYESLSAFNRAFQSFSGVTPSRYRAEFSSKHRA